jgi:hypothetical protein
VRALKAAWRAANPDKERTSAAAWAAANADKMRANRAAWAAANTDKVRASKASRRARKRGALGPHHTAAEFAAIVKRQKNRCIDCKREFGPGLAPTRGHLRPLVLGGSNAAFNIAAQCQLCNSKQGAKLHPSVRGPSLFDAKPREIDSFGEWPS